MATTWTNEQLQAIEEKGKNIIVSAGAGSGKTTVLTERVIRKLKQGIDINKLLILTFTDAASQEMKERIREAIKQEPTLSKQLDLLTTAYICTFDSFSLSIVRKYHYLLNIDSSVNIMDNNINVLEIKNIINNIFDEYYGNENPEFLDLIFQYCVKDDEKLKSGILSLYNKIDLLVEKEEYLNSYFDNNFTEEKFNKNYEIYEQLIRRKINEYIDFCDHFIPYYSNKSRESYNLLRERLLSIVYNQSPISDFDENIKLPKMQDAPDEAKNIKTQANNLKKEIISLYTKSKEKLKTALFSTIPNQKIIVEIIKEIDKRINDYKRKYNTYTFMDIAKMAIKVVKENEIVKEELKNNLYEIMIDEYQDTSDIQEYFINLIANNNVYMVGDIKQSIYRFRNANPYLFQSKYDNYGNNNGGIKIDLTNNFRSRLEVVNNINNIFSQIMTQDMGGAEYQKDHIMQHGNKSYNEIAKDQNFNSEVIKYYPDEQKRIKNEEIEAFIIASDIRKKIDNKYQVMDKKTKQARDVRYDDFVILVSKSKHFEMYKKVFNYFQIPLNIYKNEEIKDDYDIKVVYNILRLIITNNFENFKQEEKYALTSILRSYVMSYSDDEIFKMFYNNDFYNNEVYLKIKELRKYKDIISIGEMLEKIDDSFEIINKAQKTKNIKKVLVHYEYLINLSNSLSDLGYSLEDYTKYLNDVFDNDLKIEYQNKLMSVDNAVKIMTIHKSKGLEFGICYFPTLSDGFNLEDNKKEFAFDSNLGIIIPQINNGKKDTFLKCIYNYKEKIETISEEVRVWYVALTRAKEKMIFISKDENKEIQGKIKSFNDFMFNYFSTIDCSYNSDENLERFIIMNRSIKKTNFNELVTNTNKLVINEMNIKKELLEKKSFSKNINQMITKETKETLEFGTQMHEALEKIDFKTKDYSVIDLDSKYYKYLEMFLNNELLKNINEGNVYKEYQFYDPVNNVNGSIDLMIEYNDYIDIIDYKLKHIEDEGYLKQLAGYKNYIENKTNKKVNTYLYSIIEGKAKEL